MVALDDMDTAFLCFCPTHGANRFRINNECYPVLALLDTVFFSIFLVMLVLASDVAKVVNHLRNSHLENVSKKLPI